MLTNNVNSRSFAGSQIVCASGCVPGGVPGGVPVVPRWPGGVPVVWFGRVRFVRFRCIWFGVGVRFVAEFG